MARGLAIIVLGFAVVMLRGWIAREELEYLRRHKLELYRDARTGEIIFLAIGVGIVGIGLLVLALSG